MQTVVGASKLLNFMRTSRVKVVKYRQLRSKKRWRKRMLTETVGSAFRIGWTSILSDWVKSGSVKWASIRRKKSEQINNFKVGALLVHSKTLSTKEEDHIRWRWESNYILRMMSATNPTLCHRSQTLSLSCFSLDGSEFVDHLMGSALERKVN